ncbi:precorrin-3B C(17)-methyltransferase, partial [Mesorhizobium sp. M4B.F.Ca.ET.088.02.2.1]
MSGRLTVIGLGPGNADQVTPEASRAVSEAKFFYGYRPYVDRLELRPDQTRIASDNREELARSNEALAKAAEGHDVAVVSGGDPGVFAMAAAICEAIEAGPTEWRAIDLAVVPGVTAMLAVAARIGAPLGHDFCAISLSDNLKPWDLIELRLLAAAGAGFVIALYNPISKARPLQL